jgi:hypothetical protein
MMPIRARTDLMNKFNQWLSTAPTWQFLIFLTVEAGLLLGTMHLLDGWTIAVTVG